jgi:hypothetical protein
VQKKIQGKHFPVKLKIEQQRNSLKIEGDLYTIRKKVIWNNLTTQKKRETTHGSYQ